MRAILAGLVAAILATVIVAFMDPYLRFVVSQTAIIVIAVLSLNLLSNVAGMLSLASAAFMGVGGYGALAFLTLAGIPLIPSIVLTIALGWIVGWLMGLVAVRLSGISLAIVTFGFVQVFQVFAKQGGALSGDGYGLVSPPLTVPGLGPMTSDMVGLFCVFVSVIVVTLTMTLTRSRIGRAWYALKDNPVAAEMQGVNLSMMRAQAFATAGAMATGAGILQAFLLGITNPNLYTIDVSIGHLAMMVVGGSSGGVLGAILGPILLFSLPEYFDLGEYREVLYGAVLLGALVLAPRGLAGGWHFVVRRLRATRAVPA